MLLCVRTTIDLPDELFRRLKRAAADEGIAMRDIMVRALIAYLDPPHATAYKFDWTPVRGGWNPDLPIDSNAALIELLDPIERYLDPERASPHQ
jgi:hypothetical protein